MQLSELIKGVREQNLSKEQLENYNIELSNLFVNLMLEMADLEKEEAMFMGKDFGEKKSVADRKILWKITDKGQRLIVLKRYQLACKELLNSLKSRIYTFL